MKKLENKLTLFFFAACGIIFLMSLTSCDNDDEICNCGLVMSRNSDQHSILIKNECTGHARRFYLSSEEWLNAFVNKPYCMSNQKTW